MSSTRTPVYPRRHRTDLWSVATLLVVFVVLLLAGLIAYTAFETVFAKAAGASTGQVSITAEDGMAGNAGVLGPVVVIGLTIAAIKKVTDFPAYIKAKDWNATTKTVLAWAAGILFAFLLQATDFAKDIQLAGVVLADTGAATVIFFGLALASTAAVGNDVLAAIDRTRSSAVPPLVGPPTPPAG